MPAVFTATCSGDCDCTETGPCTQIADLLDVGVAAFTTDGTPVSFPAEMCDPITDFAVPVSIGAADCVTALDPASEILVRWSFNHTIDASTTHQGFNVSANNGTQTVGGVVNQSNGIGAPINVGPVTAPHNGVTADYWVDIAIPVSDLLNGVALQTSAFGTTSGECETVNSQSVAISPDDTVLATACAALCEPDTPQPVDPPPYVSAFGVSGCYYPPNCEPAFISGYAEARLVALCPHGFGCTNCGGPTIAETNACIPKTCDCTPVIETGNLLETVPNPFLMSVGSNADDTIHTLGFEWFDPIDETDIGDAQQVLRDWLEAKAAASSPTEVCSLLLNPSGARFSFYPSTLRPLGGLGYYSTLPKEFATDCAETQAAFWAAEHINGNNDMTMGAGFICQDNVASNCLPETILTGRTINVGSLSICVPIVEGCWEFPAGCLPCLDCWEHNGQKASDFYTFEIVVRPEINGRKECPQRWLLPPSCADCEGMEGSVTEVTELGYPL